MSRIRPYHLVIDWHTLECNIWFRQKANLTGRDLSQTATSKDPCNMIYYGSEYFTNNVTLWETMTLWIVNSCVVNSDPFSIKI